VETATDLARSRNARLFFARAKLTLADHREPSTHQPAEDIFHAHAERYHRLHIRRRTRAESSSDLERRAGLAALTAMA
jgi:hypothetical protein